MEVRIYHDKANKDKGCAWAIRVFERGGWANYPASKVFVNVPSRTEETEENTPQKYYMVCKGELRWVGSILYVEPECDL